MGFQLLTLALASSLIIGISSVFCHIGIICFSFRNCKFFCRFLAFSLKKTYNGSMDISEFFEGAGVYKVPVEDLPDDLQFIRCDDKGGEVQPLLHVCHRELLKKESGQFFVCATGRVIWNYFYGWYKCFECEEQFESNQELCDVWRDGKGTGAEGHA